MSCSMAMRSSACSSYCGRSLEITCLFMSLYSTQHCHGLTFLSVIQLPVNVGHYEIDTCQIRDQIRNHAAADDRWNLLQVRKTRRADARPVTLRAAVRGQIITVEALGGLDH